MKYAPLGRTGVQISKIGLGSATFGVAPLEADAIKIVDRAFDLGINHFDCANSYGNQARFDRPGAPSADQRLSAEEIMGKALKGKRDRVLLTTKVMEPIGTGPNDRGLSRVHIMQMVERSLKRLGTDYIDIYYMHHPDVNTPFDQTLRAFDDLVHQGKIRYPALSTYTASRMTEALWVADKYNLNAPVANQMPYNLEFRSPEREVIPVAKQHGLSLTVFSPLAGGLLASPQNADRRFSGGARWGGAGFTPEQLALAKQFHALAQKHDVASPVLALAWLVAQPTVASAVIGPETLDELEANAKAGDYEISPELLAEVTEIGKPAPGGFRF